MRGSISTKEVAKWANQVKYKILLYINSIDLFKTKNMKLFINFIIINNLFYNLFKQMVKRSLQASSVSY